MRLFVAIDIPEELKQRIGALQGGLPDAHWSRPDLAHITLSFLGEVSEADMLDLGVALGKIISPNFTLKLEGVGVFGNTKRPRILWAGVEQSPALFHLQQKVTNVALKQGLQLEDRRFKPHITLARIHNTPYEKVRQYLSDHALFKSNPFAVDYFTLYSSQLGHGGPHYEEEFAFDLTPIMDNVVST